MGTPELYRASLYRTTRRAPRKRDSATLCELSHSTCETRPNMVLNLTRHPRCKYCFVRIMDRPDGCSLGPGACMSHEIARSFIQQAPLCCTFEPSSCVYVAAKNRNPMIIDGSINQRDLELSTFQTQGNGTIDKVLLRPLTCNLAKCTICMVYGTCAPQRTQRTDISAHSDLNSPFLCSC